MKKVYLCISLMLATLWLWAQNGPTDSTKKIRLFCGTISKEAPLYLLNNEIVDSSVIRKLDVSTISNIEIMKHKRGLELYGSRGTAGVIVIRTINASAMSLTVVDAESGDAIPGATIFFRSGKNKKAAVSDRNGFLQTDELKTKTDYEVIITSVGYMPDTFLFKKGGQRHFTRKLQRETIACEPVIIKSGFGCILRKRVGCRGVLMECLSVTKNRSGDSVAILKTGNIIINTIYPNPVVRTSSFVINVESQQAGVMQSRILSMSGETLRNDRHTVNVGNNRISQTTGNWAAGTYLFQLTSEDGKNMITKKIVLQ